MVRGTKIETHLDKLKQARCEQEFIELIQNLLGIKDSLSAEELTQKFTPKALRKLPDNALPLPKSFSPMWSQEKLDSDTYTFDVKWQHVASLEDDSNHYYSLSSNKDMQSVLDFIEAILPNSCSKQSRCIPCTFVLPTEVLDVRSMDGASLSWTHSTISKEDLASFIETRHAWNLLRFLSSIGIEPEGAKGILVALGVLDEHNSVDWFIGHQEKGERHLNLPQ
ncbi:hypothetical protein [Vibrio mexicanus]|uniref:hypothetical protein n=1 Tax=Vibrio mexicanus TaxID=1004326 RepID=UPI00063C0A21|nr:hypothetical protein [Vibrio mexicanus]